jgi:signal transduction histidine kinase
MKFSFKKRIAVYNTLAVAITTAIVFMIIYAVVYFSSFRHLDKDIILEKEAILSSIDWKDNEINLDKLPDWEEEEHKKVEANPTFIQIVDDRGQVIFKSANLKGKHFFYDPGNEQANFYNTQIDDQRLRLGQFPIKNVKGKLIGQLSVGVSRQESHFVLNNLLVTLLISFPILLMVLYAVIYVAATRAIAPVHELIRTASRINDSNIDTRLDLPENQDEIYQLATTINDLLSRLEAGIQQQKQFTADASHEIKTPLTAIRGTLEVLLRKQRQPQEYEEKIKDVTAQADRLNLLIDQLLQLARLESGTVKKERIHLREIVQFIVLKWEKQLAPKEQQVTINIPENIFVQADKMFLDIILDNLLSNAIKYGASHSFIHFNWDEQNNLLSINNEGPCIPEEQIPLLFNRFYRVDDSRSSTIPGSGLGLAIVKKLADLQHIIISVKSTPVQTSFILQFPA